MCKGFKSPKSRKLNFIRNSTGWFYIGAGNRRLAGGPRAAAQSLLGPMAVGDEAVRPEGVFTSRPDGTVTGPETAGGRHSDPKLSQASGPGPTGTQH